MGLSLIKKVFASRPVLGLRSAIATTPHPLSKLLAQSSGPIHRFFCSFMLSRSPEFLGFLDHALNLFPQFRESLRRNRRWALRLNRERHTSQANERNEEGVHQKVSVGSFHRLWVLFCLGCCQCTGGQWCQRYFHKVTQAAWALQCHISA